MKNFIDISVCALLIALTLAVIELDRLLTLETAALEEVTAQLMEAERKVDRRGQFIPSCKYRQEFDEELAYGVEPKD